MKNILIFIFLMAAIDLPAGPTAPSQEFYAIRIYQLKTPGQEARVDKYLQSALLPALHRRGIPDVGVFKPIGNDTAAVRRIYLLIPFRNLEQYTGLTSALAKDAQYLADGKDYLDANYDDPPFGRFESVLLQAFPDMPRHAAAGALQGPKPERIYELRSYE